MSKIKFLAANLDIQETGSVYPITRTKIQLEYSQRNDALNTQIFATLAYFLEIHGLYLLFGPLRTILTEITNNAYKANLKRVLFKNQNLDLKTDYAVGQERFKKLLHSNSKELLGLADDIKYTVKVTFDSTPGFLVIKVRNNSAILESEYNIVKQILQDPLDTNGNELKEKEGGGLGLKMIMLILTNLGLKNTWNFKPGKTFTEFTLKLPGATKINDFRNPKIKKIAASIPKLLPVYSKNMPEYTDKTAWKLNQLSNTQNNQFKTWEKIILDESNLPKNLTYPQTAQYYLNEMELISTQKYHDYFKKILKKKHQTHLKDLEVFLLSDRISFTLSNESIQEIHKFTGRNPSLLKPYFPASHLGLYPGDLIQIWLHQNCSEKLINHYFSVFKESHTFIIARIMYLVWSTKFSRIPKEFDWNLYTEYLKKNSIVSPDMINLINKINKPEANSDRT